MQSHSELLEAPGLSQVDLRWDTSQPRTYMHTYMETYTCMYIYTHIHIHIVFDLKVHFFSVFSRN